MLGASHVSRNQVLRDLFQYFFHLEILNHQVCQFMPFQLWGT